jgi:hypothetical protein
MNYAGGLFPMCYTAQGSNLFYFKAEAAGGTNTPAGSPLSVIPLEFSLLEAEGQPTETASGKPMFALSLKVSPEFWPRSKHKSYLFGLKSQEAQVSEQSLRLLQIFRRTNHYSVFNDFRTQIFFHAVS